MTAIVRGEEFRSWSPSMGSRVLRAGTGAATIGSTQGIGQLVTSSARHTHAPVATIVPYPTCANRPCFQASRQPWRNMLKIQKRASLAKLRGRSLHKFGRRLGKRNWSIRHGAALCVTRHTITFRNTVLGLEAWTHTRTHAHTHLRLDNVGAAREALRLRLLGQQKVPRLKTSSTLDGVQSVGRGSNNARVHRYNQPCALNRGVPFREPWACA